MYRFTYNRGQWTDSCDLPEWADNEEFSAYIRRIGYAISRLCVGAEHGSCIELYESSNDGSFYASVAPMGSTCYEVFLPDFPSLMLFLKEFGPAFSLLSSEGEQHEIFNLLEKLFRVYHGHAPYELCKQCDPQGWEANLRLRDARAKSKSETA
jgi:hypothetical protein